LPQFLLGYLIYKTLATKLGYKPILLTSFGLSLIVIVLMAFLDNPYLYVIFNFILGLTFGQVFYSFFGIAIM
jgi:MFS family permease